MPKFFVSNEQINNNIIEIIGMDVNHITNVLRLGIDEKINICNKDTGENFIAKIIEEDKEKIVCQVLEKSKAKENRVSITIFQGLPKADKMELIIQKCTELGVEEITPVEMEYSVVKLDNKSASKKIERWQKISEAASKQCKRSSVCKINNVTNIKNICENNSFYDILIVPYENEKELSFKQVLNEIKEKNNLSIAIVIGPEGGFKNEEIDLLKRSWW